VCLWGVVNDCDSFCFRPVTLMGSTMRGEIRGCVWVCRLVCGWVWSGWVWSVWVGAECEGGSVHASVYVSVF